MNQNKSLPEENAPQQPIKSDNQEKLPFKSQNISDQGENRSEKYPNVSDYGRGDVDPSNKGGMIFDPSRDQLKNKNMPGDFPPGTAPPEGRFDPYGPPNPDSLRSGSSSVGQNPAHLPPPDVND